MQFYCFGTTYCCRVAVTFRRIIPHPPIRLKEIFTSCRWSGEGEEAIRWYTRISRNVIHQNRGSGGGVNHVRTSRKCDRRNVRKNGAPWSVRRQTGPRYFNPEDAGNMSSYSNARCPGQKTTTCTWYLRPSRC